ncbi:MAG: hypothetical protein WBF73_21025 [Bradyrhizobium sp.]
MDALLAAKIGFRPLHRLRQRFGIDRKRGLTGAMFVAGVVANGFYETYIE